MTVINRNQKIMIVGLIIGNFLMALMSTVVFLLFLGAPFKIWIFINICAPIQFITIVVLLFEIKGKQTLTMEIIMSCLLFRFGTLGMIFFPWGGNMIQAQISHIIMTLTVIYFIISAWKSNDLQKNKKILIGLIIGVVFILILNCLVFPVVFQDPIAMEFLDSMGFTG